MTTVPIENPLESLAAALSASSHNWSRNRRDAWVYGIVIGWEGSINEVAKRHWWEPSEVARLKRLHDRYQQAIKTHSQADNPHRDLMSEARKTELWQYLQQVGERLRSQDNRATDAPMFVVQEKVREWGYDLDYCEDYAWLDTEGEFEEADADELAEIEAAEEAGTLSSRWQKTGYKDHWRFVTACFTEQGCRDFLDINGHNLKETRIYAAGSYRNQEFRAVRDFLMSGIWGKE